MFLDLILNLTLLIALTVPSGFLAQRWSAQTRNGALIQGALFGAFAVIGMLHPAVLIEGVFFDGRSLMLSMCALFFGPWAGMLAAVVAIAGRLWIGGAGVIMGVMVILSSTGIGLWARIRWKPQVSPPSVSRLYLVGIVVHLIMLTLIVLLPGVVAAAAWKQLAAPVLVLYPLATILVGKILSDQQEAARYLVRLQSINKHLDITLQSIGDAVITTDLRGIIVSLNPVAEQITGWSRSEALGQPAEKILQFKNEATLAPMENPTTAVLRSGNAQVLGNHTLLVARDGSQRPIAESAAPIRDEAGNVSGVVLVFSDQTAQYAARQALEDSEERLRLALTATDQGLYDLNVQTGECVVSPEYARMLGYEPAEFRETNAAWRERLHPEDREEVYRTYAEYVAGQRGEYRVEFRQRTRSGDWKWILSLGRIVAVDAEGRPLRMLGTHTDITVRKQAETVLKESNRRFHEMLENVELIAMMLDQRGRITFCNDFLLHLTGWRREEIIGCDWFDNFIPDEAAAVKKMFFDNIEAGKIPPHYQNPIKTRTGELRTIAWNNTVLRDSAGHIIGSASIGEDITERERAERRVADALHYTRTILEHSPAGIISYTVEGDAVSANATAARTLGATVEQLKAQNFRELESWQRAGLLAAAERALQTGEEQALEAHLVTTFGREVWLACHFAAFAHEGRSQLLLMFLDISEARRVRERLRLQGSALEATANAIVITNRDGVIEWANSAFTTFTGYTTTEAIGRQPGELLKSGKHDQAFYQAMWETVLAGQVWRGEMVNRRKDGTHYTEEMTITPLKNELGGITHFIAVKQDVTQRKALEEQFRQAHKMEAIGHLAGGVAHDFNNMLAVILGNASLIEMNLSPEERQHALQEISRAAERATGLTRQLLTFSRRQILQVRSLDLNEIVTGMVKMLHRIIGEDVSLQTRLLSGGAPVQADPGMIEQVLLNLTVNARDAMPDGGEITVTLAHVTFNTATAPLPPARPGDFIRLSVRDTGSGIAPEHLPRIFEPFFTTKDVGRGTGLGLATVHGIVEQHHGWIEVESSPGAGATFHIYLPRQAVAAQDLASSPNGRIVPGGDETILLVEDETALRLLVARALERYGYQVIETANGVEAQRAWDQHKPTVDLLLTDIIMPQGISGRQLAEQLCAERPDLKVIYMSGYPGDVAGRGLELREGINYLKKPFGLIPLAEVVRRRLDESRQPPA